MKQFGYINTDYCQNAGREASLARYHHLNLADVDFDTPVDIASF